VIKIEEKKMSITFLNSLGLRLKSGMKNQMALSWHMGLNFLYSFQAHIYGMDLRSQQKPIGLFNPDTRYTLLDLSLMEFFCPRICEDLQI
jgi:hypothetical protein